MGTPLKMTVWDWLAQRNAFTEASEQDNNLASRFIPNAITIYAVMHQDADGSRLVQPMFRSQRRANVRCDRLKARTGEAYYVEPVELRE